jgi:hypothetical protein
MQAVFIHSVAFLSYKVENFHFLSGNAGSWDIGPPMVVDINRHTLTKVGNYLG